MNLDKKIEYACKTLGSAMWVPLDDERPEEAVVDLWGTRNGKPTRFTNAKWGEDHFGGSGLGTFRWYHDQWNIYDKFEYTHWRYIPEPPNDFSK